MVCSLCDIRAKVKGMVRVLGNGGIAPSLRREFSRVLFVESACRVETLSATGRACYTLGLADAVLVQWPQLRERYPRAEYVGLLS